MAVAALMVTGCNNASTTHSAAAAASVAAAPSTAIPQVTDSNGQTCDSFDSSGYCPGDDPLTCDTVIDPTGWSNGPLTEVRAIAIAAAVSDTDFVGIIEGTLSDTEMHLLNYAATELNDSGDNNSNQLGQDSQQFANDESSYANNNGDTGPQDTAYAESMTKDVIVLVKDCPHAYKLGKQMAEQG